MVENIKMAISVLFALIAAMPQEYIDAAGVKSKIPDDVYINLLGDGVMGVVTAAGFQVVGLSDAQLRGAGKGLCSLALAWEKAPRVVQP